MQAGSRWLTGVEGVDTSTIVHVGDGHAGDVFVGGVASSHSHALVQDDVHAAIEEEGPGLVGEGVADEYDFIGNAFKGKGLDDALVATADIVDANEGVVPVQEITHDVEITDDVVIAGAGHDVKMHLYSAHQRTETDFPVFSDLVKMTAGHDCNRAGPATSLHGNLMIMGTCLSPCFDYQGVEQG